MLSMRDNRSGRHEFRIGSRYRIIAVPSLVTATVAWMRCSLSSIEATGDGETDVKGTEEPDEVCDVGAVSARSR